MKNKSKEVLDAMKSLAPFPENVATGAKKCTWCGGDATEFRDALSAKEHGISGFCQKCQDDTFGGGE